MQAQPARRQLLAALFAAPPAADAALPPPDSALLLLNRSSFGATAAELARARSLGLSAYLAEQLAPQQIDDSLLDARLAQSLPTLGLSNAQLIADYAHSDDAPRRRQPLIELQAATLSRQLFSRRQLFEVLVEFWSNHFNVTHSDGPARYYKTVDDREVIRAHALGRFADLLRASAQSPAMLAYLDNASNVVDGPNENYARELLELHTLGVDGGYSESDVAEVARCFTGWSIDRRAGQHVFRFVAARHDFGAKQVLGRQLPAGQGIEDGLAVLDLLATHPSTARHIARKLLCRFVEDFPAESLVQRIAAVFTASGGDIRATVQALLESAEFRASADAKFKRPAEFALSSLRSAGARVQGEHWLRIVADALAQQGQTPLNWPAPNGYPDVQAYWLNTAALLQRWNFVLALFQRGSGSGLYVDIAALYGSARTPAQLVDALALRLLQRPLAAAARELLLAYAAQGAAPERVFTPASLDTTARELAALLLASPYHHYR